MHTVYKVTNLVNGKIYIGVHKTENPNDAYRGSGNAITRAHKKYGIENFSKEILYTYNSGNEKLDSDNAYLMEEKLVTEDFIKLPNNYNSVVGGRGCRSHTDEIKLKISKNTSKAMMGREVKPETRDKISKANKGKKRSDETKAKISSLKIGTKRKPHKKETKDKISKANTGMKMTEYQIQKLSKSLTGRKLSDEHRLNISKASKGRVYPMGPPCEYCGKIVRKACYKRYHGDNCKMRKQ